MKRLIAGFGIVAGIITCYAAVSILPSTILWIGGFAMILISALVAFPEKKKEDAITGERI